MYNIDKFILKGKHSEEGYNSIQKAFFIQSKNNSEEIRADIDSVNEILIEMPMPLFLIDFYRTIKNPNIEYYYGNWTLFSLINIKDRYNIMKEIEQYRVIDFSMLYLGLGHIIVASFDPIDNRIFFRRDGGANGFERIENWNFIKEYKPEVESKLDFSEWINLAKGKMTWMELETYLIN